MDSVSFLNSLLDKIDSSSSSCKKDGGHDLHHTAAATTPATNKPIVFREQMNKDSNSDVNMIKDNTLHLALPYRSDWFEYYDSASGKHYYHDRISNTTTWDKPADFEKYFTHNRFTSITIHNTPFSSSSSLSSSSSSLPSSANQNVDVDYRVVGTFNKITGRFTNAGPESYWDKVIHSIMSIALYAVLLQFYSYSTCTLQQLFAII
jgi:hypothetical protein